MRNKLFKKSEMQKNQTSICLYFENDNEVFLHFSSVCFQRSSSITNFFLCTKRFVISGLPVYNDRRIVFWVITFKRKILLKKPMFHAPRIVCL